MITDDYNLLKMEFLLQKQVSFSFENNQLYLIIIGV